MHSAVLFLFSQANSVRRRVGRLIDGVHGMRRSKADDSVTLTVRNDLPRYDTAGEIVDAQGAKS